MILLVSCFSLDGSCNRPCRSLWVNGSSGTHHFPSSLQHQVRRKGVRSHADDLSVLITCLLSFLLLVSSSEDAFVAIAEAIKASESAAGRGGRNRMPSKPTRKMRVAESPTVDPSPAPAVLRDESVVMRVKVSAFQNSRRVRYPGYGLLKRLGLVS